MQKFMLILLLMKELIVPITMGIFVILSGLTFGFMTLPFWYGWAFFILAFLGFCVLCWMTYRVYLLVNSLPPYDKR